ncbi:MAG TPA: glycosyltransferase family 87 protein [Acidimicrobiales bacterium]|nr:glycosyltransferase family 87 protein [Acidimicrobiales bacterium]
MSTTSAQSATWRRPRWRGQGRLRSLSPEAGDAVLYLMGAFFALVTILTSATGLYVLWAELALAPFLLGMAASAGLAARRARGSADAGRAPVRARWAWAGRAAVALCVFAGAVALPMSLEILWRFAGDPGTHQQPEVITVEHGGQEMVRGLDPYHPVVNTHHVVPYHAPGELTFPGFMPYLPLMALFGVPSSEWPASRWSDARIFFCLTTLVVTALALWLCPANGRRKIRALQVLVILPMASLPLATGGDDIPVVAFLLLAMALAQRRRPLASGMVLGIASALKFTAWPLAVLALWAARDRSGRPRPGRMLTGMMLVVVPAVFPFAWRGPWALFQDVVLFPLGLTAIHSTADSALPGHVLVSFFPSLHRVLPLSVGLAGGALLARRLYRRPPRTVAQVCTLAGVVMAALTLLAPDPRIGFLLYPINFFVWSYLFAEAEPDSGGVRRDPGLQAGSGTWKSRRVKSVLPAAGAPVPNEVGPITAPSSQ